MLVCVSVKKSDHRGVYLQVCSSGPDKWPAQTVHQQVQSGMTTPYRQTLMHSHTNTMNTTWIASFLPQVRSKAQNVLFTALGTYNFCCRDIIPAVLEYLDPNRTDVTQQQFKVGLTPFTMTKPWKNVFFLLICCRYGKLNKIPFDPSLLLFSRVPCTVC